MTGSMKWWPRVVVTLLAAQLGCSGDSATAPAGPEAWKIEALSPTSIVGTVGELSPVAPAIRVTGSRTGKPQVNVPVQFFPRWGSSVDTYITATNSEGVASAGEWRFSQRAGANELVVFVNGSISFSFIATLRPDVADHLTLTGGEGLAGIAGETLEGFTVGVEDRFDNPLPQVEVKFTVIEGGGTLETEKATTDGDGYARAAAWRLGATPGTNQASASVAGIDPLLIRAEGLDSAKLKWYTLESIGELKVPGSGIDKGRIGLTPFNPCLCGKQQGFFLRDITYTGNPFIGRTSGSYLLDDAKLSTPTLWTWENGSITGGMLVFDAADPWDGEWTYTWVYREVEANGQ